MFEGRTLIIATKHQKESVIAPILESELGVNCIISDELDTDLLGTFSGEIERKLSPLETARKKCFTAMELAKCDLAIASEGSFGMHPSLFFAQADDEILVFIDKKNNLEIKARELSTTTNFNAASIQNKEELEKFKEKTLFPSHGLIARKNKDDFSKTYKGIVKDNELEDLFNYYTKNFGSIYLETDMRAMYNPTRMKVIENATRKLLLKIKSLCPDCKTPGFDIDEVVTGLPCSSCKFPTQSTLIHRYVCQKCNFTKDEKFPNGKTTEDPMFCDFCNP